MKAIIIAGGRGERLKPLTNQIPKPMIKISGIPILEHIINHLWQNDISSIIISLCFRPQAVISYFGDGSKFRVKINYIIENENTPLGTAGSILNARDLTDGTFIVVYADILRQLNIKDVISQHKKNQAFATLVVYKNIIRNPKSIIELDERKRIIKFIERPKEVIKRGYSWSNGSFYLLEPTIFDYIPPNGPSDFGKDVFPALLADHKKVFAYISDGYFIDIADRNKLNQARITFRRT